MLKRFGALSLQLSLLLLLLAVVVLLGAATAMQQGRNDDVHICRALALGGGGDLGAFEAGAFSAFVDHLPAEQLRYDVVSGISAGSINAIGLAQFPIGKERDARDYLVQRWKTIKRSDVWKNWLPGGIVEGFFVKPGLLDTAPLYQYLQKNINITAVRNSGRLLHVGATSLDEGAYVSFNQSHPNLLKTIMASSAIPGIFPPVDVDGTGKTYYVDGGLQYMTPIQSAIRDCYELKRTQGINASRVRVQMDVMLAIGETSLAKKVPLKDKVTPFVLLQTFFTVINNIFTQDIQNARISFPDATIRVVKPTQWLGSLALFFNNNEKVLEMGYKEALKIIGK